jgi:DNA polymerase-3 subunit gamma/tau
VIEIDAASHGGVDDARDLRERAFYSPVSGRYKIYIIDEAHMVTREGFNALLKLVEEPPPHLKFVFATTEPEKVIATIRSRTHHYPFRLVPPAVLRELLEEILQAERINYEPAVLPLVVRAGAGSARDALSVLDQLMAGSGEDGLRYDQTVALLGYTDDSLLDAVTDAFATRDGAAVFGAVDKVVESGHDPRRFATDLLDRLRDLIVLAAVPTAGQTGLLDVPADRIERMTEQAGSFGQAEMTRAAEIVSDGLIQMRGATSPRLLLELMCAQVLLPGASTGEKALIARLERLERRLGTAGQPAKSPREAAPEPRAAPATGRPSPRRQQAAPTREAPPKATAPRPAQSESAATAPPAPASAPAAPAPASAQAPASASAPTPAPAPASAPVPASATASGPAPASAAAESAAAASSAAGPAEAAALVSERWPEVLEAVKGQSRVAWMLLSNATVYSVEDGVLTVLFAREGEARGFSARGSDRDLVAVLASLLGTTYRVRAMSAAQLGGAAAPGATPARGATPAGGTTPASGAAPAPRADPAAGPGPASGRPPAEGADLTARGAPAAAARAAGGAPATAARPAAGSPSRSAAQPPTGGRRGHEEGPQSVPDRPASDVPSASRVRSASAGAHSDLEPGTSQAGPAALTGMDLIKRDLGGRVIAEIDEP